MYLCWPAIFTATLVPDLAGPQTAARRPAALSVVGPAELRLAVCLSHWHDPIARSFGIPIRRVQRTRRDRGGGDDNAYLVRRTEDEVREGFVGGTQHVVRTRRTAVVCSNSVSFPGTPLKTFPGRSLKTEYFPCQFGRLKVYDSSRPPHSRN